MGVWSSGRSLGREFKFADFGVKMVFMVMRLEEITMRMSVERDEDKRTFIKIPCDLVSYYCCNKQPCSITKLTPIYYLV